MKHFINMLWKQKRNIPFVLNETTVIWNNDLEFFLEFYKIFMWLRQQGGGEGGERGV